MLLHGDFSGVFDGVIFKNIYDPADYSSPIESDIFVLPQAKNIKSATGNRGTFDSSDSNIYHQIIGEQGARQQLDEVRRQYEGTDKWMKAPNGKKSNLNKHQWLQVRTPNFKRWFGDWENDPKNASKVLDENGEPRVVYHGTASEFSTFDIHKLGSSSGDWGFYGRGFYFAFNEGEARTYSPNKRVLHTFLNIRNPFYFKEELGTYGGRDLFPMGADDAVYVMNWVKKFPELSDEHFVSVIDKNTSEAKKISLKDFVRQLEEIIQTKSKNFVITEDYDQWLREKVYRLWFDEDSSVSFVRKNQAENKLIQAYYYLNKHVYRDIDIPHISTLMRL